MEREILGEMGSNVQPTSREHLMQEGLIVEGDYTNVFEIISSSPSTRPTRIRVRPEIGRSPEGIIETRFYPIQMSPGREFPISQSHA